MDYSNLKKHLKTYSKEDLIELFILMKMELKAHLEGGDSK